MPPSKPQQIRRPRSIAAWLLGLYLDFTLRSTRWTIEGQHHLDPFLPGGAVIVATWHERLPLIPAFWTQARRRYPQRGVAALASRHRDGQLIAGILARFGVRAIHGSTARTRPGAARRDQGGAAGLRQLLAALEAGEAVVITPDGPRGPRRVAAPGVAQLARLSAAPVLAVSGAVSHRIVLSSWDRMMVPLPFGRGVLVCLPGGDDLPSALNLAAGRADAVLSAGRLTHETG